MRPSKRDALLKAANHIVARDGVERLTLDAVARETAVSKGGVLYHFPTKEALVAAMLERLSDDFEASLDRHASEAPGKPGRWLRAYLASSTREEEYTADVLACLLAGAATNPALLAPLRERWQRWQDQAVADGVDETTATLVRLAVDGLWFADLFGFAPPRGRARKRLIARLQELTRSGHPRE